MNSQGIFSGDMPVYCFHMTLAGLNIEVECRNIRDFADCYDYVTDSKITDISVRASDDDIANERIERTNRMGYQSFITEEMKGIESQVIYRMIADQMLSYNTILMHGSVVAMNNKAYMFIAPSGTGKTTRTKLWIEAYPNSYVVNGDKPLVRVTDTKVIACGSPWCGKEGWNTNVMIPLKGILLLERANDNQSSISEINMREAFPVLLQQTYRKADITSTMKTIQLLFDMEKKVKFYRFRSTPDIESISLAYETVCK